MKTQINILHVEDDPDDVLLVQDMIHEGWQGSRPIVLKHVISVSEAIQQSQECDYDLFLLDYSLGGETGLELIRLLREHEITAPIIVMTGIGSEETAVALMKAGANDYLPKRNITPETICRSIRYSLNLYFADKQRQESEKRFRHVVETVPDILYQANFFGYEATYMSPSLFDLLGFTPDEFIKNPHLRFLQIHEDDQLTVMKKLDAAQEDAKDFTMWYRIWKKDRKSFCWVEDRGIIERDSKGKPITIYGSISDITERKRIEQALRDNEVRYRDLFNNMGSGVAVYEARDGGEDFVLNNINRAGENISCIQKKDAMGKSIKKLFPGVVKSGFFAAIKKVWETGESTSFPIFSYEDKRLYQWVENFIYKLPSQEIVAVYDDITERKSAVDALTASESKYRQLFGNSADAIIIFDAETFRIEVANQKAFIFFGFKEESFLSLIILDISVDVELMKKRMARLVVTNKLFIPMCQFRKKDGTVFLGEVNAWSFTQDGQKKLVCSIRDITDRKKSEELIQSSLKEKEVLLREIHHRVKNNMQVISSLLKLQSNQLEKNDASKEMALAAIHESRHRVSAMALVHDKLYRSETLSKINLRDYFNDIAQELAVTYGFENSNYQLKFQVDDDVTLGIDKAVPLGLIANELITNAMKYAFNGEKRGSIDLKCRFCQDSRIEFIVADDGEGFSDSLDWHKSETLGLRLVQTLARQIQAELTIKSDNGAKVSLVFDK
ncbi:MAG: PAS domain S-box protein [Magnetococcales bacterium]|nr:PAS domain S-box protein [Magnetococcales bacterium]